MDEAERAALIDRQEAMVRRYNDTDDEALLEEIALIEMALFATDPDPREPDEM